MRNVVSEKCTDKTSHGVIRWQMDDSSAAFVAMGKVAIITREPLLVELQERGELQYWLPIRVTPDGIEGTRMQCHPLGWLTRSSGELEGDTWLPVGCITACSLITSHPTPNRSRSSLDRYAA